MIIHMSSARFVAKPAIVVDFLVDFLHRGTANIEITGFVLCVDISQRVSEQALLVHRKSNTIPIWKIDTVEHFHYCCLYAHCSKER